MKYIEVVNQNYHMQGFTTDDRYMYWSFTDSLVKTTMDGTVLRQVPTATFWEHLGGIDYIDGKIYGASMARNPNNSSIHVYDADTLATIKIIQLRDCVREADAVLDGFNGIGCICEGFDPNDGERCLMVGGAVNRESTLPGQIIFTYTFDGKRKGRYVVQTGATLLGIQNIDLDPTDGCYYMTSYGSSEDGKNPHTLYKVSADLTTVLDEYYYSSAYGIHCLGGDRFYMSLQSGKNGHRNGFAYEVDLDFVRETSKLEYGEGKMNAYIMPMFDEEMGL